MSESATEVLRRMLDERDVEYEVEREGKLSEAVLWDGPIGTKHSAFVSNENPDKATGEILYATLFLTPEQAIAATLGGGKLTAEQVCDAVMSADRLEKPMGNTGLTNTHLIIRDDGWQAIADELNATLGSGTCEMIEDPPEVSGEQHSELYPCDMVKCSACGAYLWDVNPMRYCPNCGAKVKVVKR